MSTGIALFHWSLPYRITRSRYGVYGTVLLRTTESQACDLTVARPLCAMTKRGERPMTMTAVRTEALTRSDAVLRILEVLDTARPGPVERLVLEGMAYMAQQPDYERKDCRVLRAFDSDEWRPDLHDSMAYLQQMGRVQHHAGSYSLTARGQERLQAIDDPPGLDRQNEVEELQTLAHYVRTGLGL